MQIGLPQLHVETLCVCVTLKNECRGQKKEMLEERRFDIPKPRGPTLRRHPGLHRADPQRRRGAHKPCHCQNPREVRVVQLSPYDQSECFQATGIRRLPRQRWGASRVREDAIFPVRQYLLLPSLCFLCRLLKLITSFLYCIIILLYIYCLDFVCALSLVL